jgi:hypothetical protein
VATNQNVHCNVCCVKITIKKVAYLQTSIKTIENLVILTIEGKQLEATMNMSKVNFFIQPHLK